MYSKSPLPLNPFGPSSVLQACSHLCSLVEENSVVQVRLSRSHSQSSSSSVDGSVEDGNRSMRWTVSLYIILYACAYTMHIVHGVHCLQYMDVCVCTYSMR